MINKFGKVAFVLLLISFICNISYAYKLNDIDDHWAFNDIKSLVERDYIKGYKNGKFNPDGNITRAEFISVVNKVFNYDKESDIKFKDVGLNDWFYKDVKIAIRIGYIKGYKDNTFRPNEYITRQEVAVIIDRIYQFDNIKSRKIIYLDEDDISNWAKESVIKSNYNGYIKGYKDNTFRPKKYITRAEIATLVNRIGGLIISSSGSYYKNIKDKKVIKRNVTLTCSNIKLYNVLIKGDLYITEGVGFNGLYLQNVDVRGRTIIKGGNRKSIISCSSDLGKIIEKNIYGHTGLVRTRNSVNWGTVSKKVMDITSNTLSGEVLLGDEIILSSLTDNVDIYYTLDGSNPTIKSNKYINPIIIEKDMIIKVIGIKHGYSNSNVSSFNYIVKPVLGIKYESKNEYLVFYNGKWILIDNLLDQYTNFVKIYKVNMDLYSLKYGKIRIKVDTDDKSYVIDLVVSKDNKDIIAQEICDCLNIGTDIKEKWEVNTLDSWISFKYKEEGIDKKIKFNLELIVNAPTKEDVDEIFISDNEGYENRLINIKEVPSGCIFMFRKKNKKSLFKCRYVSENEYIAQEGESSLRMPINPGVYYGCLYNIECGLWSIGNKELLVKNDEENPIITLSGGDVILEAGDEYIEPGFMAIDNVDLDITNKVISDELEILNNIKPDVYYITYFVSDLSDNTTSVQRKVTVVDTTPPILVLNGLESINVELNDKFVDPFVSAIDIVDGDITDNVNISGAVDTSKEGEYELVYNVKDSNDNAAVSVFRKVLVQDLLPPNEFDVDELTTLDNDINEDGKSIVDVKWNKSSTLDVDHYYIVVKEDDYPTIDDKLDEIGNISKEAELRVRFEHNSLVNLYVGVVAVDCNNKKTLCFNENANIVVCKDTDKFPYNDILEFSINGVNASIDLEAKDVVLELPYSTDIKDLVAKFKVSKNAKAYVNDVLQQSEHTKNDFSENVIYKVVAENGDEKCFNIIINKNDYSNFNINFDIEEVYSKVSIPIVITDVVDCDKNLVNESKEIIIWDTINNKDVVIEYKDILIKNGTATVDVILGKVGVHNIKIIVDEIKDSKTKSIEVSKHRIKLKDINDKNIITNKNKNIEFVMPYSKGSQYSIRAVRGDAIIQNIIKQSDSIYFDMNIDINSILEGENTIAIDGISDIYKNDAKGIVVNIFKDTKIPICNISNGYVTNDEVNIVFSDENIGCIARLNDSDIENNYKVEEEGKYNLEVLDKAGNVLNIKFIIDKTPPELVGINSGDYINDNKKLVFYDNLSNVSATLDGNDFYEGDTIESEGNHTLILFDEAGNISEYNIIVDTKEPIVNGVLDQEIYNHLVTIEFSDDNNDLITKLYRKDKVSEYQLISENFSNNYNIEDDGIYKLKLIDIANNSTSVEFIIDKTDPFVNIEENSTINKNKIIIMDDEMTEVKGKIKKDSIFASYATFKNNSKIIKSGDYKLKVTDEAGNEKIIRFSVDAVNPKVIEVNPNNNYEDYDYTNESSSNKVYVEFNENIVICNDLEVVIYNGDENVVKDYEYKDKKIIFNLDNSKMKWGNTYKIIISNYSIKDLNNNFMEEDFISYFNTIDKSKFNMYIEDKNKEEKSFDLCIEDARDKENNKLDGKFNIMIKLNSTGVTKNEKFNFNNGNARIKLTVNKWIPQTCYVTIEGIKDSEKINIYLNPFRFEESKEKEEVSEVKEVNEEKKEVNEEKKEVNEEKKEVNEEKKEVNEEKKEANEEKKEVNEEKKEANEEKKEANEEKKEANEEKKEVNEEKEKVNEEKEEVNEEKEEVNEEKEKVNEEKEKVNEEKEKASEEKEKVNEEKEKANEEKEKVNEEKEKASEEKEEVSEEKEKVNEEKEEREGKEEISKE